MKKMRRLLCGCFALLLLLTACGENTPAATTKPTTKPVTPVTPVSEYDPDRPLPVLEPKFVNHEIREGDFVIAQNGVPCAQIVISVDDMYAEFAADDLAAYLKKITGGNFEIITEDQMGSDGNYILVGATQKTLELGEGVYEKYPNDEGFVIRREGNYLILVGNDSQPFQGTQFAVTRFLEEAGCGWYSTSTTLQVVPQAKNLSVSAVDREFRSRFTSRAMTDIPNNLAGRWYLGGQSTSNGHALPGIVRESDYATVPEFFALVNGSRDPSRFTYWHYCYTNPDFAARIAEGVIASFNRSPHLIVFPITANDGWNEAWCECENCTAAGNHADQMVIFANNVAEIVAKVHPDRQVSILAYHSTFLPPENEYDLHPNVVLQLCLETAPFADLSKNEQIHNGYHPTNKVTYSQSWLDSCKEYIRKTNAKNVSIWGWYCVGDGTKAWKEYPWVQGNTCTNNFHLFEELGAQEVYYDCDAGCFDVRWPLYFVAAKSMWEGEGDAEAILYDACKKLFGAAADEMFLYYRHLADAAAQYGSTESSVTWVPPKFNDVYGADYNLILDALLAAFEKKDLLTRQELARLQNQAQYWAT